MTSLSTWVGDHILSHPEQPPAYPPPAHLVFPTFVASPAMPAQSLMATEPQSMSITTDLLEKKITFTQAAAEFETWGAKLIKANPAVEATVTAGVSTLKQAASNAISYADTEFGALMKPETAALEVSNAGIGIGARMRVWIAGSLVGDEIVFRPNSGSRGTGGDLAAVLTNLEPTTDANTGPSWVMVLEIGEKQTRRTIKVGLYPFLSDHEYQSSLLQPFLIPGRHVDRNSDVYLFRGSFFVTERPIVTGADREEAVLRVKKAVYEAEGELTALRSFVANIEAAVE